MVICVLLLKGETESNEPNPKTTPPITPPVVEIPKTVEGRGMHIHKDSEYVQMLKDGTAMTDQ